MLDVVIPKKINNIEVKHIGSYSFLSRGLISLVIPNTVLSLAVNAFDDTVIITRK